MSATMTNQHVLFKKPTIRDQHQNLLYHLLIPKYESKAPTHLFVPFDLWSIGRILGPNFASAEGAGRNRSIQLSNSSRKKGVQL